MNNRTVIVAAGIVEHEGKILIAQRKADSFLEANKWEIPGGKIEFGEHPAETVVRELKEELGISVTVKDLVMMHSHTYEKEGGLHHILLAIYTAAWDDGDLTLLDCQNALWIDPQDLETYNTVGSMDGIIPVYHAHRSSYRNDLIQN